MIKKIYSTLFFAKDLDKTCEFYKKLGFDAQKFDDAVRVVLGEVKLAFVDESKNIIKDHAGEKGIGIYTYVEVDDVDQFYNQIKSAGLNPSSEPKDWPWGKREFVLRDPDGYKLVFFSLVNS